MRPDSKRIQLIKEKLRKCMFWSVGVFIISVSKRSSLNLTNASNNRTHSASDGTRRNILETLSTSLEIFLLNASIRTEQLTVSADRIYIM
jgi:hypothetical protein